MSLINEQTAEKQNYVYMVECRDGSFYTGWTTDADRRIRRHNSGLGSKYTRSRLPVTLVYLEKIEKNQSALSREAAIKKLKRSQKLALIRSEKNLIRDSVPDKTARKNKTGNND